MNKKTLIIYSSKDGQTLKIAKKIAIEIQSEENDVEILNLQVLTNINKEYLEDFDKIIIGASVRYGNFSKQLYEFIQKNKSIINEKYTAFFGVNLLARKKEKSLPENNPYMISFFKKSKWKPDLTAVFAGALKYKQYNLFDKYMILFIMFLTKGPLNKNKDYSFTEWQKVKRFSIQIKEKKL